MFFNNGGNGNNFTRPDQVAGCDTQAGSHSALVYINPSCFVAAPAGQLGDANRVPVTGPGFVNTDFSIIKQFALPREGMGLNFRAEFFNLFNHAQFGFPGCGHRGAWIWIGQFDGEQSALGSVWVEANVLTFDL